MNEVIKRKGYFISYNPMPGRGISFWEGDNKSEETALAKETCKECGTHYYILNGDFRKEYQKLISKGFNACLKFYNSKKAKYNSSWTTEH
jgi:hypothetical protein